MNDGARDQWEAAAEATRSERPQGLLALLGFLVWLSKVIIWGCQGFKA